MFGQQFSGINAVIFYSVSIFEAAHTSLNSFVETIIVAGTMVGFSALVLCLVIVYSQFSIRSHGSLRQGSQIE